MSKIYKVDFGSKEKETKTISELFDSIQFYRSEGRSISAIHAALCRFGLWQKSLSSFANEYYQHRRQQQLLDPDDSQPAKSQQRSHFKSQSTANSGLSTPPSDSSKDEPSPNRNCSTAQ